MTATTIDSCSGRTTLPNQYNSTSDAWDWLSVNINAMHILENNQDKINYSNFSTNPGIFKLDIVEMRNNCCQFAEELAAYVFHPDRLLKICEKYKIDFYDLMEIY